MSTRWSQNDQFVVEVVANPALGRNFFLPSGKTKDHQIASSSFLLEDLLVILFLSRFLGTCNAYPNDVMFCTSHCKLGMLHVSLKAPNQVKIVSYKRRKSLKIGITNIARFECRVYSIWDIDSFKIPDMQYLSLWSLM